LLADGVVAHEVSASKAHESDDWLRCFSPRLQIGHTPAGTPWIWYQ
jgi:hypothetical protein